MNYINLKQIDSALQDLLNDDNVELKEALDSILTQLPMAFNNLIDEAFIYKRVPKEYLLSGILFALSSSIGLTFYVEALGFKNYGNCYFTIVGSRGDAKSEAIKIATNPIKKMDDLDYKSYLKEKEMHYNEDDQPKRKQSLIQNATIEAAQKVHFDNPNSIGLLIDEIYTFIVKMSNPNSNDGIEWRKFFLEGYTNGHIDIARKTTTSFRINETYPTLIGGLQHQFLHKLFSNGNLESGFIDRQFFTNLITSNKILTKGKIKTLTIQDYENAIHNVLAYKKQSQSPDELIKQFEIKLSKQAEDLIFEYTQDLINRKAKAPKIIKEYYAKMQISIQKLCVIVFMMRHATLSTFATDLSVSDVKLAIDINEFYFLNFKLIIKNNFNNNKKPVDIDVIIQMAKTNNASQKAVAEVTGLNKGTISRKWNHK